MGLWGGGGKIRVASPPSMGTRTDSKLSPSPCRALSERAMGSGKPPQPGAQGGVGGEKVGAGPPGLGLEDHHRPHWTGAQCGVGGREGQSQAPWPQSVCGEEDQNPAPGLGL
ncbi:hypothetical protein KIL84_006306 [Mauremys mutica]|uniref:Uncharacterized protein n=1 Tax=Mauremys mutica TaxID=74926 RepID=A0A9D3X186_9SAUR|nr:hypothetical protein KIL84_006306 [Mauremys mutica]